VSIFEFVIVQNGDYNDELHAAGIPGLLTY